MNHLLKYWKRDRFWWISYWSRRINDSVAVVVLNPHKCIVFLGHVSNGIPAAVSINIQSLWCVRLDAGVENEDGSADWRAAGPGRVSIDVNGTDIDGCHGDTSIGFNQRDLESRERCGCIWTIVAARAGQYDDRCEYVPHAIYNYNWV